VLLASFPVWQADKGAAPEAESDRVSAGLWQKANRNKSETAKTRLKSLTLLNWFLCRPASCLNVKCNCLGWIQRPERLFLGVAFGGLDESNFNCKTGMNIGARALWRNAKVEGGMAWPGCVGAEYTKGVKQEFFIHLRSIYGTAGCACRMRNANETASRRRTSWNCVYVALHGTTPQPDSIKLFGKLAMATCWIFLSPPALGKRLRVLFSYIYRGTIWKPFSWLLLQQ